MISKILFPIDSSETAERGIGYVRDLATKFKAEVTLLHAFEIPGTVSAAKYGYELVYDKEMRKLHKEQSHQMIEKFGQALENDGIVVHTVVAEGSPREVIMQATENEACDLILMGTRGLGPIQRLLLGSVSNYIIHHAKCPVLLIPTP